MIIIAGSNGDGTDISTALGESFKSIARQSKILLKNLLFSLGSVYFSGLTFSPWLNLGLNFEPEFSFGSPKVNPILSKLIPVRMRTTFKISRITIKIFKKNEVYHDLYHDLVNWFCVILWQSSSYLWS